MPTDALIIRPGRRLVVELDLPGMVAPGYRVWFEVTDPAGHSQLAGDMTTDDRDLWRVEFPGTATADVTADGSFEAVSYTMGADDATSLAAGPALVRPAIAETGVQHIIASGPKGDRGDVGPAGATGATGPQGAQGAKGDPGPAAPVLTPPTTVTYNGDGTVATQTIDGVATTYTYNGDGTVATETRAGVTRTYGYTAGNLTSVA